ncbi:MAG: hypothetical protein ACRDVG_12055, partial [Jatrophihabitantaceae bacterium]
MPSPHPRPRRTAVLAVVASALAVLTSLGTLAAPAASARTAHAPYGALSGVFQDGQGVLVTGWAYDPNTSAAATVYVMVDGRGRGAVRANRYNPHVANRYPGLGFHRGFSAVVSLPAGTHRVCQRIVDYPRRTTTLIGCRAITLNYNPIGSLASLTQAPGTLTARGWAIDPGNPRRT